MNLVKKIIPFALIALGAVFIIVGQIRHEDMIIFSKAATVCLECIGIG